jgi:oligopeptidase B
MATAVSTVSEIERGPEAPLARIIPRTSTLHGDVRVDNYDWLRNKNDPEVMAHLQAENAFTDAGTRHTAELQERLYREIVGRIKETDLTVPWFDRGWWYYTRTEQGKAYPIHCRRRETLEAGEEIYLDQNHLAAGQKFHALGGTEVSPDGRTLLYLEDTSGFREYTLYVKDLLTGTILDRIPDVWNGTAWADDNRTFFYLTADPAKRGSTVWRHVVGRPREQDEKIFEEENILFTVGLTRSKSGRYVIIASEGFTSSEVRVLPTDEPWAAPRVVLPRRAQVEYTLDHVPGMFLLCTNDGAVNFKVVSLPEDDPSPEKSSDWLGHREDIFVEGIEVFRDHVVVLERVDGLRRLRVQELGDGAAHYITFPDHAYGLFLGSNADFESEVVRFTYSSLVTPNTVYDYHLRTRTHELRKRQEIPSGYDPTRYEVRRLMVTARDGARVPASILSRSGLILDGSHPLLLHGYGAYGTTTEPIFNSAVLSLVNRGFLYAIAHVRGGQEMGRPWYDDGKMLRKLNSFHDLIDVAEELVRRDYTAPDRMVAAGGSAGGLLVGAVANMRPDLFRAIVADVPFVDVINTMLDASLPLTAQEWQQWGNPTIEAEYRYMMRYSPYDNVTAQAYPWMLVTTSLNDSQVMYWEPAKWVARLRATKRDGNPLYLKINMTGGHTGASGRYERLREIAFRYAFMLDAVGLAGRVDATSQADGTL